MTSSRRSPEKEQLQLGDNRYKDHTVLGPPPPPAPNGPNRRPESLSVKTLMVWRICQHVQRINVNTMLINCGESEVTGKSV